MDTLFNFPAKELSRMGTGGPIDILVTPKTIEELKEALITHPSAAPIHIIGGCSNILFPDDGLRGLTISMRGMNKIELLDDITITADAGANNFMLAKFAMEHGISGFEFLAGIPGTVGGGILTNAGAHGQQLSDVLVSCDIIDTDHNIRTLPSADLNLAYRSADLPDGAIVTSLVMRGKKSDPKTIKDTIDVMREKRMTSQPVDTKNLGSTFKNPDGNAAWRLIEDTGLRGTSIGGAKISDKHLNFIENYDNATTADILALINKIQTAVSEKTGISLETEIRIL